MLVILSYSGWTCCNLSITEGLFKFHKYRILFCIKGELEITKIGRELFFRLTEKYLLTTAANVQ